jgi:aspartate beta-hydroxylase
MCAMSIPDTETAGRANSEGMAAIQAGDSAAAIAAFERATAADPTAGPLWRNLAHAYRLGGDDAAEEAALNRALSLDRLDFTAHLRMAQLLQRRSEETRALIAWGGVEQLAAGLPQISPSIEEELLHGSTYCNGLRAKLGEATEIIGRPNSNRDETENRRIRAFVDTALGKRQTYQNQCQGAYYPFLPPDEFFDRRHFPWFEQLEAGTTAIKQELADLLSAPGELLRPYVRLDEGSPENPWSALDGSLDWSACFLWEYGEPNEAVIARCPQTAKLLESLPLATIKGRAPNAFFSMLKPGSHIPAHTGVTNTRAIIHLALDIPQGCGFRVGSETREWIEGKAFAFDDTIEHEAWNQSDKRRAVLIIDSWNPHLSEAEKEAIVHYFATADSTLVGGIMA